MKYLGEAIGCLGKLSNGSYIGSHKDYLRLNQAFEVYIKSTNFNLKGFKIALLILSDSKTKGWDKNWKH